MDDEALLRYDRHILLPEFGYQGQEKLSQSHVLILGIGGLGSPAALYLASSGIGSLTLVDDDVVELSNLQRQIIHHSEKLGSLKVKSAQQQLKAINPGVQVFSVAERLETDALLQACQQADVVLDCTDTFAARFAINAACAQAHTPLVSGAAIGFDGQLATFLMDGASACYQCLYPREGEESLRCAENGILAPVVGTIGVLQALEAIKLLTHTGKTLAGKLLLFDGLRSNFRTLQIPKNPKCPICSM